jgi:hypothetical protein
MCVGCALRETLRPKRVANGSIREAFRSRSELLAENALFSGSS